MKLLGVAGRGLWRRLTREYEFTPGQRELLRRLCLLEDRLSEVRAELAKDGMLVVSGRQSPYMLAERDLVAGQVRILKLLGLHADEATAKQESAKRRSAALLGYQRKREA